MHQRNLLFPALGAAAGLLIGYLIARPPSRLADPADRPAPERIGLETTASAVAPASSLADAIRDAELRRGRGVDRQDALGRIAADLEEIRGMSDSELYAELRRSTASGNPSGVSMRQQLLLTAFAERSPEEAMSWCDRQVESEQSRFRQTVLDTWSQKDPVAAAGRLKDLGTTMGVWDKDSASMAAIVAGHWADRDTTAALGWASGLPEEVRGEAIASVVLREASRSSEKALSMVQSLPAGYERDELMGKLAGAWAEQWPERTADWAAGLGTTSERTAALEGLTDTWARQNGNTLGPWIESLPTGAARDVAVRSWNQSENFLRDPAWGISMAFTIESVVEREQAIQAAWNRWNAYEPEAAEAWRTSIQGNSQAPSE
ncbi:MAG: hypothetical protein FJ405_08100 [Verrucomicrobia bacterium]|nr:hypothetical protein [Verrucomicrobiota bacterium]